MSLYAPQLLQLIETQAENIANMTGISSDMVKAVGAASMLVGSFAFAKTLCFLKSRQSKEVAHTPVAAVPAVAVAPAAAVLPTYNDALRYFDEQNSGRATANRLKGTPDYVSDADILKANLVERMARVSAGARR